MSESHKFEEESSMELENSQDNEKVPSTAFLTYQTYIKEEPENDEVLIIGEYFPDHQNREKFTDDVMIICDSSVSAKPKPVGMYEDAPYQSSVISSSSERSENVLKMISFSRVHTKVEPVMEPQAATTSQTMDISEKSEDSLLSYGLIKEQKGEFEHHKGLEEYPRAIFNISLNQESSDDYENTHRSTASYEKKSKRELEELDEKIELLKHLRKKVKSESEDDVSHASSNFHVNVMDVSEQKASQDTSLDDFKCKENEYNSEMEKLSPVNSDSEESIITTDNNLPVYNECHTSKQHSEVMNIKENNHQDCKVHEIFSTDILKYFSVISELGKAEVKKVVKYLSYYKAKRKHVLFRSDPLQNQKRVPNISDRNLDSSLEKKGAVSPNSDLERQFACKKHFQSNFGIHSSEKTVARTETNFSFQVPSKVSEVPKQRSASHHLPVTGLHPPVYSSESTHEISSSATSSSANPCGNVETYFDPRRGEANIFNRQQTVRRGDIQSYFYTLVLQWNPSWLLTQEKTGVCPPICDSYQSVKSDYLDETEYFNTYFPLHLLSVWFNIYDSWRKQNDKQLTCAFGLKENVLTGENFFKFRCTAEIRHSCDFPKRKDIVLCKHRITQEEAFLLVSCVEVIEPNSDDIQTESMLRITFESLKGFTIRPGDFVDICILLNTRSSALQSEALMSLNPAIRNLVLKPNNFSERIEVIQIMRDKTTKNHTDEIFHTLELDHISVVLIDASYPYDAIKLMTHIAVDFKHKVLICTKSDCWFLQLAEDLMPYDPLLVVRSKDILSKKIKKFKRNTLESAPDKKTVLRERKIYITKLEVFQAKDRKMLTQEKLICIVDEAHLYTEAEIAVLLSLKLEKIVLLGYHVMQADLPKLLLDHGYGKTLYHRLLKDK